MPTTAAPIDADETDVAALGARVAYFLKGLAMQQGRAGDVETDHYDTVYDIFVTIEGKRYCVSVEPDGRA